jgi:hypothetical protein
MPGMSEREPDDGRDGGEGRPDGAPAPDDEPVDDWAGRRRRWSRWIAGAVLVGFGAFVLWNALTILLLLYRSIGSGSGPFGQ